MSLHVFDIVKLINAKCLFYCTHFCVCKIWLLKFLAYKVNFPTFLLYFVYTYTYAKKQVDTKNTGIYIKTVTRESKLMHH